MTDTTLTAATPADWPALRALYAPGGLSSEHLARSGAGVWIVARRQGVIVGAGEILQTGRRWEMANVVVSAGARRRGVGAALVNRLLEEAAARGARQVELLMPEDADGARRLYRRAGFRPLTTRRLPNGVAALLMRVELAGDSSVGPGGKS